MFSKEKINYKLKIRYILPTIPPPLAWFIMESPSILLPLILFPFGQHFTNPKALVLMSPYLLHYFHRTFIYPLRIYKVPLPRIPKPLLVSRWFWPSTDFWLKHWILTYRLGGFLIIKVIMIIVMEVCFGGNSLVDWWFFCGAWGLICGLIRLCWFWRGKVVDIRCREEGDLSW